MTPETSGHDHDAADAGRRVRRASGPRAQRQREQARDRRRRFVRRGAVLLVVLGLLGVTVPRYGADVVSTVGDWVTGVFASSPDDDATPAGDVASEGATDDAAEDRLLTLLLVTLDEAGGDSALGIQLLSYDLDAGRGAVVFVPATMVADVPGNGLLPVGQAASFGGVPLLELTLENQLSIDVDASAGITEQGWAALLGRVGGFEVDVRQGLTERSADGVLSQRFEPGPQFLDGPRLAELLTFVVEGEAELAAFSRTQQVYEGLLAALAADGVVDATFGDGAPMLASADVPMFAAALTGLAEASTRDGVVLRTLPVTAVGSGDEVYYRLDAERAASFVEDVLGGPRAAAGEDGEGVRLEVLNGNGTAGIGADVASRLVPLGHTVVITRNAETFDHASTRVVLHGDDPALLRAAQGIVDALGVGTIEISPVPSTIVDITVLVGADFLP